MTQMSILRYNFYNILILFLFHLSAKRSNGKLWELECLYTRGIPTIVMQHTKLATKYASIISQPKSSNHIIFIMGCLPKSSFTFFPKGAKEIFANLKHCTPSGAPTMVIQRISPATHQSNAEMSPPKIIHRILAISLIIDAPLSRL